MYSDSEAGWLDDVWLGRRQGGGWWFVYTPVSDIERLWVLSKGTCRQIYRTPWTICSSELSKVSRKAPLKSEWI
jgi:hypothetical protein